MTKLYWVLPVIGLVVISIALKAQPNIGGYNVYYGHLHNHSAVSDGVDSPGEAYRYARESGHLDFFGLSDHSEQIHGNEWEEIKNAADQYNQPGAFTTFHGFEWTDNQAGHVTVINTGDYTTPSLCNYSFSGLCNWLNDRECVAFFNHPGRYNSNGQEFEHFEGTPSDKLVGIELWNRSDRFEMFYFNDGYFHDDDNKSCYDEALIRGWKIGAAGSEDNHSGNYGNYAPSKLAVLAYENSRASIFEALKTRRFFSTYDKNMALSFRINGREMGSEVYAGNQSIHIQATDGDGENFSRIELIKNGEVIQSWSPNTSGVDIEQSLRCGQGDYYYLHVHQEDGDEAITSPIWISKVNRLPQTSLSLPLPNTYYLNPASVIIEALAEDSDGQIDKVEFYVEEELVGVNYERPYSITWECTSAGTFRLKAIAIDNMGGKAESDAVRIVITNPGEPVTISSQIASDMDDVEESSTGNMTGNMRSTDIELVNDFGTRGENQKVGLRFTELYIPQGVYITNAFIQFTSDEQNDDNCQLIIAGEASANSGAFTRDSYNVSQREQTQARVLWVPAPWPQERVAANAQRTPDLSAIVQEIITHPDYAPGGAISMIITGTGTRTAVSYEGSASEAPSLVVTFSYTKPNDPPVVTLTSPQNEAIYMAPATLTLQADALDTDGQIEKVDFYLEDTLLATTADSPYAFEWRDVAEGTYAIKAIATDNNGDMAVSNTVLVTVTPQVVLRTFDTRISSAADDAEETYRGLVSLNGDDIELVYDSRYQGRQTVGLRFNNVVIPPQAVIKKASIQFTADEKTTIGCSLEIRGEGADHSKEFSIDNRDISRRPRTKAAVGWIAARWARVGQSDCFEQTPDLKTIVQEIVDRPGWSQGNSLSFIVTGLGIGKRTAVAYETSLQKAARLVVEYEVTIYRNAKMMEMKGEKSIDPSTKHYPPQSIDPYEEVNLYHSAGR